MYLVHGESTGGKPTGEYTVWQMMKDRCLNKNAPNFKLYGGRGIRVCDRWLVFSNFLADVGRRPSPQHTLDRKNNAKGYTKSNCRWATKKEQGRNRRDNKINAIGVAKLKSMYATGRYSQRDLVPLFGISQQHICKILKGQRWSA